MLVTLGPREDELDAAVGVNAETPFPTQSLATYIAIDPTDPNIGEVVLGTENRHRMGLLFPTRYSSNNDDPNIYDIEGYFAWVGHDGVTEVYRCELLFYDISTRSGGRFDCRVDQGSIDLFRHFNNASQRMRTG